METEVTGGSSTLPQSDNVRAACHSGAMASNSSVGRQSVGRYHPANLARLEASDSIIRYATLLVFLAGPFESGRGGAHESRNS